ncbi:MAG: hypothetical protein V1676_06900 [Candidatus Diapherotrites archaeon]
MKPKLRVMLDTNVYDSIISGNPTEFSKAIKNSKNVTVYGNKVIRGELRGIPMGHTSGGRSTRNWLLTTYDFIVGKHNLEVGNVVRFLAMQYWESYHGGQSFANIIDGFLIVACASIHKLDIVCSQDARTMKSGRCLRIYLAVNKRNGFYTPRFISFGEFKGLIET